MDCTMVAAAPVLPVGYVVSARRGVWGNQGTVHLPGSRSALLLFVVTVR